MGEREIVREKLRRKEAELHLLEEKIRSAKIYVQALQDIIKALEREDEESTETILRSGSSVAQARDFIIQNGKPAHINELMQALGKEGREARASLTGSLSAYVRREEIFTRPAPNTFGLIELGHQDAVEHDRPVPPRGFGRGSALENEGEF